MNMKYFRFLYGVAAGCFMHFAELHDTLTEEHADLLYLCGSGSKSRKAESADSLFLYPEVLDLVVLGEWNKRTKNRLKELLAKARIKTLVIPEMSRESAKVYRRTAELLRDNLGEEMQSVDIVISIGNEQYNSYETALCGWSFVVMGSGTDELMMIHAMTDDGFEDIVMNVKEIQEDSNCRRKASPDKFGCAFGCTLHRDYHECKYRKKLEQGIECRMGTVIMREKTGCEDGSKQKDTDLLKKLFQESGIEPDAIRFTGISGQAWRKMCEAEALAENEPMAGTEYFIGISSEEEAEAIAELCRSGYDRIPVLLKEGQGICCSGFFKYREVNGKNAGV